ncbi:MAG: cobalamin biosynthesis protein CobD [Pyrinomonadaceae bacterium]|nr:cobalamin biosynthesis protein CobD [Pyrinomonadaceae bacterium]
MIKTKTLVAAIFTDAIIGDIEHFPHPVRIIGAGVNAGEIITRKLGKTPKREFIGGALLTVVVVAGTYIAASKIIEKSRKVNPFFGETIEIILANSTLAARNLCDEAIAVTTFLESSEIEKARKQLARIVGRDTENLDETDIARATIETLAESLCDGIIAPLFYLTIGGVPLALAYKAVNTLDSMIGHKESPYFYFGKFAARLDDLANYVPARISAVLIIAAAKVLNYNAGDAVKIWRRDAALHKSPNAGQPEAAISGALQTRLGGANFYDGVAHDSPFFGAEFEPASTATAKSAVSLIIAATVLGFALAGTITFICRKK